MERAWGAGRFVWSRGRDGGWSLEEKPTPRFVYAAKRRDFKADRWYQPADEPTLLEDLAELGGDHDDRRRRAKSPDVQRRALRFVQKYGSLWDDTRKPLGPSQVEIHPVDTFTVARLLAEADDLADAMSRRRLGKSFVAPLNAHLQGLRLIAWDVEGETVPVIQPTGLIDAIWWQFLVSIREDRAVRACGHCERAFIQRRTNQLICSVACSNRMHAKKYGRKGVGVRQ